MRILSNRSRQEVGSGPGRGRCRHASNGMDAMSRRSAIIVHVELGAADAVYIRGDGGTLRRDSGQRLACIRSDLWVWSTRSPAERFEFQLLLNDEVWERGWARVLEYGHVMHVGPDFEWPDIPRVASGSASWSSPTEAVTCQSSSDLSAVPSRS